MSSNVWIFAILPEMPRAKDNNQVYNLDIACNQSTHSLGKRAYLFLRVTVD